MARRTWSIEDQLSAECNRITAGSAKLPAHRRMHYIKAEIAKSSFGSELKIALETMLLSVEKATMETASHWEKILAAVFGVSFIIVMLIIAIHFPDPTGFQFLVFRIVLALAGAGFGGTLSGFIDLNVGNSSKPWLRAGGGLAVFVLIYLVNPAKLVTQ